MEDDSGAQVAVWIQTHLEFLIHIPKQKNL